MEELKHKNRKQECLACEKMYRYTIEVLERQNALLIEMLRDKHLAEKIIMPIPKDTTFIKDYK